MLTASFLARAARSQIRIRLRPQTKPTAALALFNGSRGFVVYTHIAKPEEVLDYWFGEGRDEPDVHTWHVDHRGHACGPTS